jgi:hypothetical protein
MIIFSFSYSIMDAVLDLTARAAAFIGVIQQLCIDHPEECEAVENFHLLHPNPGIRKLIIEQGSTDPGFIEKAQQLLLISNLDPNLVLLAQCLVRRELALLEWIWDKSNLVLLTDDQDQNDALPSQERWRAKIGRLLYEKPEERAKLAAKIKYLPIQIVLAAGGKKHSTLLQRLLQEYKTDDQELQVILSPAHVKLLHNTNSIDVNLAANLLGNRVKLRKTLIKEEVPLPFELVFEEELIEIKANRLKRQAELKLSSQSAGIQPEISFQHFNPTEDPIETAKSMRLQSIAFSGGGIRSATFNLGVLQGIAKAGLLSRFDYMSTVSGGGYLGSWFMAWVKRCGSLRKVSDRLNADKSTDPMADEVRPIRWLRMYSNYLSPNSSIMSVDSWTVGMTITRNMLLNQMLILLMLFSLLVFGRSLFYFWNTYVTQISTIAMAYVASASILLGALLAGAGMYFHAKRVSTTGIKGNINTMPAYARNLMLSLAYGTTFLSSAWLFKHEFPIGHDDAFLQALIYLSPISLITFIGLTFIALIGRYDKCIPETSWPKPLGVFGIGLFSFLAALAGLFFLVWGWKLIAVIQHFGQRLSGSENYGDEMVFTFGPPLILEVLATTIVIRMALLGIFFPDDRREWWGRVGGVVHRIAFLWILISGATLLGTNMTNYIQNSAANLSVAAGGWAALVITAVKAAFSSKSQDGKSGFLPKATNKLANAGPYLFVGGLLIFLPIVLNSVLNQVFPSQQYQPGFLFLLGLVLTLITFLLSWRVGVNEFSMHHFYKNRLVRAFLGATINRIRRKITTSPFTGFNTEDDLLLSSLTSKDGYYGPFPILNTTLNASRVSELDRQDRMGESFIFSPLYCGFDFSKTRPSDSAAEKSYDYGFRPTAQFAYPNDGPHIGSAMAISGAAANPNQGSHSSPATAFLLTAFNVRLGWWIGNPRKSAWKTSNPPIGMPYLLSNLFGQSNTKDKYVCLSDGGHFDNMGLYELVRRRSAVILLGDAEQDDQFSCEGLANAIRRCRIDFGVEITIDVLPIVNRKDHLSARSYAIGTIRYPGNKPFVGTLIYIKSSITKDQPTDVREYATKNPLFPHQSTGDQFFDETQFESYRNLGLSITELALNDPKIKRLFFPETNGNMKQHNTGSLLV